MNAPLRAALPWLAAALAGSAGLGLVYLGGGLSPLWGLAWFWVGLAGAGAHRLLSVLLPAAAEHEPDFLDDDDPDLMAPWYGVTPSAIRAEQELNGTGPRHVLRAPHIAVPVSDEELRAQEPLTEQDVDWRRSVEYVVPDQRTTEQ